MSSIGYTHQDRNGCLRSTYSVEKLLFRATWENISLLDRFFFDGCVQDHAELDRSLQGIRFAYNRGS